MEKQITKLDYELCRTLPIGTVVADAEGYWAASGRSYVKTTESSWAVFFRTPPTDEQIEFAVKQRVNNISPCPSGAAYITTP